MSTIAVTATISLHTARTLALLSAKFSALSLLESHSLSPVHTPRGLAAALESILTAGVRGTASGGRSTIFGSQPTCCDSEDGALLGCHANVGRDSNGNSWMACYYPGTEKIIDFDVAAIDRIIDSHLAQHYAGIDVAGSVCDNGYGGGLVLGETGYRVGNIKADQMSPADSIICQAAAESMLGVGIDYENGPWAVGLLLPDIEGNALRIEIAFQGHMAKEC